MPFRSGSQATRIIHLVEQLSSPPPARPQTQHCFALRGPSPSPAPPRRTTRARHRSIAVTISAVGSCLDPVLPLEAQDSNRKATAAVPTRRVAGSIGTRAYQPIVDRSPSHQPATTTSNPIPRRRPASNDPRRNDLPLPHRLTTPDQRLAAIATAATQGRLPPTEAHRSNPPPRPPHPTPHRLPLTDARPTAAAT
jgi:hypothetical protein